MPPDEKGVIEFGDKVDPDKEADYRKRISDARSGGGVNNLKAPDPVGGARPQMPNFANLRAEKDADRSMANPQQDGVQPRPPGSPLLRPETAKQMAEMADAQAKDAHKKEQEKENEKREEDILGMLDFDNRNEATKILDNKKRRKEIESRCQPMSFEDLLIKDEVQQDVPIIPGKFVARYRSYTPQESLFIKQYIQREAGRSDQYLLEKFAMCQLTLAMVSLNNVPFPDHRNQDGVPDEKLFEEKLKRIMTKNGYIVADLGVNYGWFDIRVRRLINPDDLKNG